MQWTYRLDLPSPLELTAAAKKPLPSHVLPRHAARNGAHSESWAGATYAAAIELAEKGWKDAPRLDNLAEQIAPSETRLSHQMQHAVTGAFVDVSRYLEGHPENMLEFCDEPAPKSLTIAVSYGKGANVSPKSMRLAGAVSLAVIDTLSQAGISVELLAIHAVQESSTTSLTTFPLKRATEPLDQNQLAFWICHPAALRQLTWGFYDTRDAKFYRDTNQSGGAGTPIHPSAEEIGGVDYVLSCSPQDEHDARREYHRIISEITATL